ncbi:MAG: EamA family transporter [Chloroflexi bacterium]|nr:EamA family transporter [Chloroflexota bacterium]
MNTPSLRTGMILVALAAATWGTIGVAVDLLYRVASTDAVSVGFWRMAISVPPLLILSRVFAGPNFWRIERRDTALLLLLGVSFAAYQVFYFAAIPLIGVAAAVMVNICSAPVIIALLSAVFLRERLTPIIGLVLAGAILGVGLLVGGSPEAKSQSDLIVGGALALGAGFAYSLVAIAARVVAPRYHPVQPIALAFAIGALLLLPFALSQGLDVRYPVQGWLLLIHLGLVPTGLGYWLYLRGLKTTPVTIAGAITLLGERSSRTGLAGGILLIGGIVILYMHQSGAVRVAD